MKRTDFSIDENYFTDIGIFIENIKNGVYSKSYQRKKGKRGYYVYDVPCGFDIETSSFYENGEKRALMYIWQFCFNGTVVIGRTWESFLLLLSEMQKAFNLSEDLRVFVYVHNLGYEFQFIRKWIQWKEVFATDVRKPIKALSEYGIEFRDSYILSAYSLEMTGKQLQKYAVEKKVGFLNYDVIRTPETKLSNDEILYCIYDVFVVCAYIQEQIEEYGDIVSIPLTNTGRVRNYCRKRCLSKKYDETGYYEYKKVMKRLTLSPREYEIWKMSYQGGFTHGNAYHVGDVMKDVSSYDFTSSYPYVLVSEKYPMGKGFRINPIKYNEYKDNFILVFTLKMTDVYPRFRYENPISFSKCLECKNYILNNGRVAYADYLITVCTNIDLEVYKKFYNYSKIEIKEVYAYTKGYLPKNLILSILHLYKGKTELKGVEGKENEYMHSKSMLNSIYGMMVTDIVRDEISYDEDWEIEKSNLDVNIEKYNKNQNRFLFYPWGCMVTAYARRNLFTAIYECKNDYLYSDTDSVKIINNVSHETYFKKYNENAIKKLNDCMDYYGLSHDLYKPKTIKGIEKPLGVWDYEGDYKRFKTLGAKRYIYTTMDDVSHETLHCTVAGISKSGISSYFHMMYGNDYNKIFNAFSNSLHIPEDFTNKLTHTYIDDEMEGEIDGYLYHEKSVVHLSKADYSLSMARSFLDYLRGVKIEREI